MSGRPTVYHIPVCPFSQRLEILLALKGLTDEVEFHKVDITQPRPQWLLDLTRGTTALPILVTPEGQVIKESLVILQYLEQTFGAGNGALVPNRKMSSFVFEPHWQSRPWPPKAKYDVSASDRELGLLV